MEESQFYLVKWRGNYADEFDLEGFYAVTAHEREVMFDSFEDVIGREIYFGTNEFLQYHSERELSRDLECIPLTEDEYNTLNRLFPDGHGETVILYRLRYLVVDEDEEDDLDWGDNG